MARCCFAPACSACFDRATWIATAIGSDHNPIKTRLLLVKPVAPNQRDSEKGVASPTGFEPSRNILSAVAVPFDGAIRLAA